MYATCAENACAAMQDDHTRGVLRQRQRFLQCGISAADDADEAVAEKRGVAAGTVAHALAAQLLFARDPERLQRRARGDHDRPCPHIALTRSHAPAPARMRGVFGVQPGCLRSGELRAGADCLLLNDRAQVVARDAVGKAGIAVDPLDAHQVTAECRAGQDPRLPPRSRRRQPRGQASHTAANNHQIVFAVRHPILSLAVLARRQVSYAVASFSVASRSCRSVRLPSR